MDSIEILPLTNPVEEYYIAAHALTLNLTIITANVSEFSRISNLKVENWLD